MTWEAYERLIYSEVAYKATRDKISAVISAYVPVGAQLSSWPGSRVIANAILRELDL